MIYPLTAELFAEAFEHQISKGRSRYGTVLKSFNGRNAYMDYLQEQADALVYSTQLYVEATEFRSLLDEAVDLIERMMPLFGGEHAILCAATSFCNEAHERLDSTGLALD